MKKFLALMLALVMVFALAACGEPATEETTPAGEETTPAGEETTPAAEPVTLNIGYMNNYGSLWSLITAREMGYMEEQGIELNLISFDSGPNIIAAMEGGSVDIGYIGDGAHSLCVQGNASIITLSHISTGDAVIGGPNVKTIADLEGKTVAYSTGTTSYNILVQALASVGLTMDDINGMDMDPSSMVSAMLSENVDACAIWSPQSATILSEIEGTTILADNTTFGSDSIALSSWIVLPKNLESMHDVLVRFLTALYQGMDYAAHENHEQVAQWVADELKVDYETSLGETTSGKWLTGEQVYNGVKDGTVQGYYELQQSLMVDAGTITEAVPVENYVAFDLITEVGDALYGEAA